jgi:glucosyltransferase
LADLEGEVMVEKLTIIVPVKNEEETIEPFLNAIESVELDGIEKEVLFIDDGSTDETVSIIQSVRDMYEFEIHYIGFSRNFGKEAAMYAGLEHAKGSLVSFMDVDLQDPVGLLPEMCKEVLSGSYDVVAAKRENRSSQSVVRGFLSDKFYWVMNKLFGLQIEPGERDYRVMNKTVVSALLSMDEEKRFSKGLFHWVGYRVKYLTYEDRQRVGGESSWSMGALLDYAIDGIVSFSTRPLLIVSLMGLVLCGLSFIAALLIIGRAILYPGSAVFGWPSMMVIILLIGGLQLLALGVIGRYVADVFIESKHRPKYLIREKK